MSELSDRIQADTKAAMKAGEKDRVSTLRMLSSALQLDAKEGKDDAEAVLARERKKRIEAADAFRDAGRAEQAQAEQAEAELIAAYLPEQISDEELAAIVDEAVASSGITDMKDMGRVMGAVMPKVKGRADGNRVSAAVREKLQAGLGS
jgi:uncharacterized protein YqeY